MDFTLKKYKTLLNKLSNSDYRFQTFTDFLEKPEEKVIILRHDVDARKLNSLRFAEIQNDLGIRGTYYFRIVPQSFDPMVIKKIADMKHEIGYHYEDLDLASSKFKVQSSKLKENDLEEIAIGLFEKNLKKLREIYPVKTICMHGSPRSKIDNKSLWKRYRYRDFGIIGEPYFDIDFNKVLYLTDTGRRWDGEKVSIRDKVSSSKFNVRSLEFNDTVEKKRTANPFLSTEKVNHRFRSTHDIIKAALVYNLPDKIMITFHPQRWTDKPLPWLKELLYQNFKNQIKKFYIKQT
jgi:hypothetical protein